MNYAHDLQFFIPKFDAVADGEALTNFAIEAGSDLNNLVNANLTQADDFFIDALIQMSNEEINHVKNSYQATTKLELFRELSTAPAGTFNIFPVSNSANSSYRSSQRIQGLKSTSFMSGIDDYYIAHSSGIGTAFLKFTKATNVFQYKAPGDTVYGAEVNVPADGTYNIYAAPDVNNEINKYIEIDVTFSNLPASDTEDTLTLTRTEGVTIPNTEGLQSASGITRYVLIPMRNESATEALNDLTMQAEKRTDASTMLNGGWDGSITPFNVDDASAMPASSFWLLNETQDDCAYVRYRSGNKLYPSARSGTLRGKVSSTWVDADVVSVWSDIDIALAEPTADVYPADLSTLTYHSSESPIILGALSSQTNTGICIRETIIDTVYPIDNLLSQISFSWW